MTDVEVAKSSTVTTRETRLRPSACLRHTNPFVLTFSSRVSSERPVRRCVWVIVTPPSTTTNRDERPSKSHSRKPYTGTLTSAVLRFGDPILFVQSSVNRPRGVYTDPRRPSDSAVRPERKNIETRPFRVVIPFERFLGRTLVQSFLDLIELDHRLNINNMDTRPKRTSQN